MSRGKGKKKRDKQPKSPTIVPPSPKTGESMTLPPGVAKLKPNKKVLATKEIFIAAPIETCFGMIASQLEQPRQWDMMVINVEPASKVRGRIGATSQITLNLGGRKLESLAMISRYYPNRAISWVSTKKPKVRGDWQLEQKPHGIVVRLTLAHEIDGCGIGRFLYKVRRQKRVEQDLDKTLTMLKDAAESIKRNQMATGK